MRLFRTLPIWASIAVFSIFGIPADALAGLVVFSFHAPVVLDSIALDGGSSAIDVTTASIIVTTSAFSFTPNGYWNGASEVKFPGEIGSIGLTESGDAAIHDAIMEGSNSGSWNSTNGVFSSSAANDPKHLTAVGWFDNSSNLYQTWWGEPISPSQSIIGYTYVGDCDMEGAVDGRDFTIIQNSMAHPPPQPGWPSGDINYSGAVDGADLTQFWNAYNAHLTPLGYDANYVFQPVPEPGTAGLLISGVLAVGLFRRRRR